jgi:exopolysaccharide production protein ExoY
MRKLDSQLQSECVRADTAWETNVSSSRNAIPPSYPHVGGIHVYSPRCLFVKRGIDLVGSLTMIVVSLVPALIIAAAIVLTSKGPILYSEIRIGRGGRPFRIWKFRSMRQKTDRQEAEEPQSSSVDPLSLRIHKNFHRARLTPIGGFLRKWSLDELPQLLNVLRGEMSLIGPRPVIEEEVHLYGHLRNFYLSAIPGLSGLWQISGRSNLSFEVRADLDASYVQNWSLQTDISLILRTIPAVLSRRGAR